jgi:DNA-binding transcriptional LysR family regulator
MNLNHLAVFHAVAQAGGMTLGAERLVVSQPAVSKARCPRGSFLAA